MAGSRRLRVPVLGALLLAVLPGTGRGKGTAQEPRATVGSIMIPAGEFRPTRDDWDYRNNGIYLQVDGGNGTFVASLPFPVREVKIRRIALYAYDGDATYSVGLERLCPLPSQAACTFQDGVSSTDGAAAPGVFPTTDITPLGGEPRGARVAPGGLPVGPGRPALRGAGHLHVLSRAPARMPTCGRPPRWGPAAASLVAEPA